MFAKPSRVFEFESECYDFRLIVVLDHLCYIKEEPKRTSSERRWGFWIWIKINLTLGNDCYGKEFFNGVLH